MVRKPRWLLHCSVTAALLLTLLPSEAHAYIDPGIGSLVFQAVIAGVLAAGFTARRYWAVLRATIARWLERK